jgi:GTP-binding protein
MVRVVEIAEASGPVVITPEITRNDEDASAWDVHQVDGGFEVVGKRIERMVSMTDLRNHEALRHLHRRLSRIGVIKRLEEMGAEDGDTVKIGTFTFDFEEEY